MGPSAIDIIRHALQMTYEDIEYRLEILTGGASSYELTPRISELQAAHLALYQFERNIVKAMTPPKATIRQALGSEGT